MKKKKNNDKKRRIYKLKPRGIKRGRGRPPYIKKNIYIYFGIGKKQKDRGVFGRLLKTFAAPILDPLPIWEEKMIT